MRSVIAAVVLWTLCAPVAGASDFYKMNASPYRTDLIDPEGVAGAPGPTRQVRVARATWDNYVDVTTWEVDCVGQRLRQTATTRYQNMTNGLNRLSADEQGGDWIAKSADKSTGRYVDFVCDLPRSLERYRKVDGNDLAYTARALAIDMEGQIRDIMRAGDDTDAGLAGKF